MSISVNKFNGPRVVWFTGLSGAGKSTLGKLLRDKLINDGFRVLYLDGDEIRQMTQMEGDFTPAGIRKNFENVLGLVTRELGSHDLIIVAVITPFQDCRDKARKTLGKSYLEVYVSANLEVVVNRDVKGLYKKALKGEINNFVGISKDVPFEIPKNPEIIINSGTEKVEASLEKVYQRVLEA